MVGLQARFLSNGTVAVALYNQNDQIAQIGLDFAALAAMTPSAHPSASGWGWYQLSNSLSLC
jgi:hypothetical protein